MELSPTLVNDTQTIIGLLRIALALSVVVAHTHKAIFGLHLFPGPIAVEIFFLISGYYMGLVLQTKYNYAGSYWSFIRQRFLRLVPLYWFILLSSALVFTLLLRNILPFGYPFLARPQAWQANIHSMSAGSVFLLIATQIVIVGQDVVMFLCLLGKPLTLAFTSNFRLEHLAASQFMLIPPAWTLSLEVVFYLMAPAVSRLRTRFVFALALVSFALKLVLLYVLKLPADPWAYRFFPCELYLFCGGILAYRMRVLYLKTWLRHPALVWLALALFLFSAPWLGVMSESAVGYSGSRLRGDILCLPFTGTALRFDQENEVGPPRGRVVLPALRFPCSDAHFNAWRDATRSWLGSRDRVRLEHVDSGLVAPSLF